MATGKKQRPLCDEESDLTARRQADENKAEGVKPSEIANTLYIRRASAPTNGPLQSDHGHEKTAKNSDLFHEPRIKCADAPPH
jgi:hypothetical protein